MIVCIAEKPSVARDIAHVLEPRKPTKDTSRAMAIRLRGLSGIFAN